MRILQIQKRQLAYLETREIPDRLESGRPCTWKRSTDLSEFGRGKRRRKDDHAG